MMATIKRHIWCYWEPQGTLPPYLQLCFRTIKRNSGVTATMVGPNDIEHLAPRFDARLAAKAPRAAQRADYLRSHLLAEHGGMWLDVDSVVLRDLHWAFDGAEKDGLAARRNMEGLSVTPLVARAGSPIVEEWIARQEQVLTALPFGAGLDWAALGSTSLTQAVGSAQFFELDRARVAPIPWPKAYRYLSRFERPHAAADPEVSMLNLYNELFPQWIKSATESQILKSPIMLSRLIRVALGESSLEDEARTLDLIGRRIESAHRYVGRVQRAISARSLSLKEKLAPSRRIQRP